MTKEEIKKIFIENNLTLGSVESFTGGLFSHYMTSMSGASKFFKGSLVTYFTEEKHRLLNISCRLINKYGVVSSQIAEAMAKRGYKKLGSDVCISFTGNAGPTAMEGKPVGLIYIGITFNDITKVNEFKLKGTREEIQNQAIELSYELLMERIKNNLRKF